MGNVTINCHSSIRIESKKILYFDPFKIKERTNDADIIFITHSHYDHFSIEDIDKVKKAGTVYVMPKSMLKEALNKGFKRDSIIPMEEDALFYMGDIEVQSVAAYNINKPFHPKKENWLGYVVKVDGIKYYIMGDTDETEEALNVDCDTVLIPIGGKYTFDYKEAAAFVNKLNPKAAIPTHYGDITGKATDGESFKELVNPTIEVKLII